MKEINKNVEYSNVTNIELEALGGQNRSTGRECLTSNGYFSLLMLLQVSYKSDNIADSVKQTKQK